MNKTQRFIALALLILAGISQMSFNHHLYKEAGFDTAKDFTYISPTVEVPFVLVASKKIGERGLSDSKIWGELIRAQKIQLN